MPIGFSYSDCLIQLFGLPYNIVFVKRKIHTYLQKGLSFETQPSYFFNFHINNPALAKNRQTRS